VVNVRARRGEVNPVQQRRLNGCGRRSAHLRLIPQRKNFRPLSALKIALKTVLKIGPFLSPKFLIL
jgi:hypothetical protein